jgi:hypothetical protein
MKRQVDERQVDSTTQQQAIQSTNSVFAAAAKIIKKTLAGSKL